MSAGQQHSTWIHEVQSPFNGKHIYVLCVYLVVYFECVHTYVWMVVVSECCIGLINFILITFIYVDVYTRM